jgi:uncharacterized protein YycO
VSKAKLKVSIKYLAKKRKTTYNKELKAVISAINTQVSYNKKRRDVARTLSVGGVHALDYSVPARFANREGDIFVSTLGSQAGGINFGHSGIYYRKGLILHAPGAGQRAQVQKFNDVQVGVGSVYMTTPLSAGAQESVAEYAKSTYEGQAYNYMYYTNKVGDGTSASAFGVTLTLNPKNRTNCSELVWASYKKKAGIDVDGYTANNGDALAVFPWDIERSNLTTTYAVS